MITSATLPNSAGWVKATTTPWRRAPDGNSGVAGSTVAATADAGRRRVRGDQGDADGPRDPAGGADLDRRSGAGLPGVVDAGPGGAGAAGVGGAGGQGTAEGIPGHSAAFAGGVRRPVPLPT